MEENGKALPSPNQLKGKIILKHKVPKERRISVSSPAPKENANDEALEDWEDLVTESADAFQGKIMFKHEDSSWRPGTASVDHSTLEIKQGCHDSTPDCNIEDEEGCSDLLPHCDFEVGKKYFTFSHTKDSEIRRHQIQ